MLRILLKKQLTEVFRSYFYDQKSNKARSKVATIAWFIFYGIIMLGVLGGVFSFLSISLCEGMASAGVDWFYFSIMGLVAILMGAFGSVFNTYSGLYLAKDNDLLLSMPIPVRYIVVSRLLNVYLLGLMYSAVAIIPAVIVYWIVTPITIGTVIGGILTVVAVSLIVLMLSCLLGWVVAKISVRLKNKSFITVIISLVLIAAYYFFYFKATYFIQELLQNASTFGESVKGKAYVIYLFGRMGTGDYLAMLLSVIILSVLLLAIWFILSRSFMSVAAATVSYEKKKSSDSRMKCRTPNAALLNKEFMRFSSSANYMLNCGLGILFLVILGCVMLIKGSVFVDIIYNVMGEKSGAVPILSTAVICMIGSTIDPAVPSVSLEGKSYWVVRSLPVDAWQIIKAKISMQLILTVIPTLFCSICAATVIPCSVIEKLFVIFMPLIAVIFMTLFDMFLGIKKPIMTWSNEMIPVKQGIGVMFALLGAWLYSMAFGGVFLLAAWRLGSVLYFVIAAAFTLLLSFVLFSWLKRKGVEELEKL